MSNIKLAHIHHLLRRKSYRILFVNSKKGRRSNRIFFLHRASFHNNRIVYALIISLTFFFYHQLVAHLCDFGAGRWSLINFFQRHCRNPPRFKTSVADFTKRDIQRLSLLPLPIKNIAMSCIETIRQIVTQVQATVRL